MEANGKMLVSCGPLGSRGDMEKQIPQGGELMRDAGTTCAGDWV